MPFALSKAVLRGVTRRTRTALLGSPLLGLAAALAVLAAPLLAWKVGHALGRNVGPSFASPAFALSFSSAVVLTSLTIGVFTAAVAPRLDQLDDQILVTPPSRTALLLSVTVLPLALPLTAIAGLALLIFAPLGQATAAGLPGGWLLLAASAAAALAGLGAAASISQATRRPAASLCGVLLVALGWAATAAPSGGDLVAGPAHRVAAAMGGRAAQTPALAVTLALLALAGGAAFLLAVSPVANPQRGHLAVNSVLPMTGPLWAQRLTVGLKVLGRRPDLRRNTISVVVATPLVALGMKHLSPLPDLSVFFAGLLAVLGSAVYPLAAPDLERDGAWLWRTSGRASYVDNAAVLLAGVLAQLAVMAVAAGTLVLALQLPVSALASLLLAASWISALGLLAGALVPWKQDSAAEQVGAYLTLLALTAALYLPAGWLLARARTAGMPDGLLLAAGSAVLLVSCVAAASVLSRPREERAHA